MIRISSLLLCLWLLPGLVQAYDSVFVTPPEVDSYTYIDEPNRLRSYYGELAAFPHTYVITLSEAAAITLQILEPDNREALQNMSGLLVREVERGVEDVARLSTSPSNWTEQYSFVTGDSYRLGPAYSGELEPGVYYIEVSNGDNLGKYVLELGTVPSPERLGYVGKLKEVYQIKHFLGKPAILVLQSPYYYIPTIISITMFAWWYRRQKQRYA